MHLTHTSFSGVGACGLWPGNLELWNPDFCWRRIARNRIVAGDISLPRLCIMGRVHLVRGTELVTLRTRTFVEFGRNHFATLPTYVAHSLCASLPILAQVIMGAYRSLMPHFLGYLSPDMLICPFFNLKNNYICYLLYFIDFY